MSAIAAALEGLLGAERGHFRYESGHHGDLWLDLDRLFLKPAEVRAAARALAGLAEGLRPEVVVGPLTGGAFLALMVAETLDTAFVAVERRLEPGRASYRVPEVLRAEVRGRRVLLADDAINAGSAVGSSLADLERAGATVVGLGSLVTLGAAGARLAAAAGVPLLRLLTLERQMWPAEVCPLCAEGVPLVGRIPS